jgi:hypothetical protein
VAALAAMGALMGPILAGSNLKAFIPIGDRQSLNLALPGAGDVHVAQPDRDSPFGASGYVSETGGMGPEPAAPPPALEHGGTRVSLPNGAHGIPAIALDAYRRAEGSLGASDPACGLSWWVLAAIGRIESGHARGGELDAAGNALEPILGPELSGGPGIAAIRDTDGGRLDGDSVWDRAVGPMQFIPSVWARYRPDGNGDGISSPHNMYDAALGAARYLCAGGGNLRDPDQLAAAVFRYNHSDSYVSTVLLWARIYSDGVTPLPFRVPPGQSGDISLVAAQLPPASPPGPGNANPPAAADPPPADNGGCGCGHPYPPPSPPPTEPPAPVPPPTEPPSPMPPPTNPPSPVPPPVIPPPVPPQPPGPPLISGEVGVTIPPGSPGCTNPTPPLLTVGLGVNLNPILGLSVGVNLGGGACTPSPNPAPTPTPTRAPIPTVVPLLP